LFDIQRGLTKAVTEFEKAAEASNAIFNAIKDKLSRRKKNSKEG